MKQTRPTTFAITAQVLTILLTLNTACITVDESISSEVEYRTYATQRTFDISGFTETSGAFKVKIEPDKTCMETTIIKREIREEKLKLGRIFGGVLLLAVLTAAASGMEVTPAEERTVLNPYLCENQMRDHPICQPYFDAIEAENNEEKRIKLFQGAMVAVDIVSLIAIFRAIGRASSRPQEREISRNPSTKCSQECEIVGKNAYLRVTLDNRPWCVELGTIKRSGEVNISSASWAEQANRLPFRARREFQADEPDWLMNDGQVVIPECGDRVDCLFWLNRN